MPRGAYWIFRSDGRAGARPVSYGDDHVCLEKHIFGTMCVCRRSTANPDFWGYDVCGVCFLRSLSSFVAWGRGAVRSAQTDRESKTRRVRV